MTGNWKTEEEAKKMWCPFREPKVESRGTRTDAGCCIASACGMWVEPPISYYFTAPLQAQMGGCGLRRLP